jgi:hypothetical protein
LPYKGDAGPTWHVAYRDGAFSDTVYREGGREYEGAAIESVSSDGPSELLFEKKRPFKETNIGELRASPDGRHLAYVLVTNLRSAIPLPTLRDEIYVLNLVTGEERRVSGDFRDSGNLMWGADAKRLYYAVLDGPVADGHRDGVYLVELP